MYRIAICDDEKNWMDQAIGLLDAYSHERGTPLEVKAFSSPAAFLDSFNGQQPYDVYLMDIYMPEMTGMEVSETLRQKDVRMPIIFLTSSVDHAIDAYDVKATHYLVKPYTKERFYEAMDRAIECIPEKTSEKIILKVSGIYHNVDIQQILFSETDGNYQEIVLENHESFRVRMTSVELHNTLEPWPQFYPCGHAYIVNLGKISRFSKHEVVMKNGKTLAIPRNTMNGLKEAYFSFFDISR